MAGILERLSQLIRRERTCLGEEDPRAETLPAQPTRGVVLLVDLDGRAGGLLLQPLSTAGFRPLVFGRDGGALQTLDEIDPAAIVVVGPAGTSLLRRLRQATVAPILALDPRADNDRVLDAFAAGIDQFQAGPISAEEIIARVESLVRRGRLPGPPGS